MERSDLLGAAHFFFVAPPDLDIVGIGSPLAGWKTFDAAMRFSMY
jgi:hypothetical protein